MQSRIPTELLDYVFLYLREASDLVSLRACSAVDEYFSRLAEPHLYYRLILTTSKDREQDLEFTPDEVTDIFSSHPHLPSYVRSLKLSLADPRDAGFPDPSLVPVLPLLQHVKCVKLEYRRPQSEFWGKTVLVIGVVEFVYTLGVHQSDKDHMTRKMS
ncbi:hypothetical protein CVT26_004753 [Gymnopilus dilepis]|uniref:F-box domain-containing protein n=1 Tax=Gymnopilus dilepis TaxID=231916 RepID=A0A409XZG9_9AGAR|nr:hypothetical protein CVT26_004753 [Gymnopilus dilepis]